MPTVILYSRPGCHLCDAAKRQFLAAVPGVHVEEVDVDSDSELRQRYGNDIPVAVAGGRELFRHRFDPASVRLLRGV